MSDVLERFSPATRAWFEGAFPAPTAAQEGAWSAISSGAHALVVAPTGSGKTLSAFLWAIDRLVQGPPPSDPLHRTRVLYVSPLKALGVDVERNLRSPLVGVTQTALRLSAEGIGEAPATITVGVRSGDTPAAERRLLQKTPPDILITTPESLYLMLTSAARESLRGVETVIVDEVHAVASTKRGAHLAVSLERLDALLPKPVQRIGLSATVRPREEVARFLAGRSPVAIVAPASEKQWDLRVVVPVEDMSELGATAAQEGSTMGATGPQSGSIWPHVEESIVDSVLAHTSSIVFANSRRLAERLTARLNEIYAERRDAERTREAGEPVAVGALLGEAAASSARRRAPAELMGAAGGTSGSGQSSPDDEPLLARAHHGSVSKEQRAIIEDDLKSGRLRCVVATSSLELGIDMGAVDLVVQVETPPSVASALQRVGRAGHQVGEVSRGSFYPKHRADLLHSAVTTERMRAGLIEAISVPANPLDILAQQTVAATALDELDVDEWFDTVRRSAPFVSLPRSAYEATLDLLSGRYPSDQFAELRPRVVWDRDANTLTGRPGAQRLAVTSGGTIPDRGLFGVFMVGEPGSTGNRVGELDEEMVYESRVGDVFALGATSWRIQEITYDRVIVTPAFGEPGRLPFWKGDSQGRPAELGEAIGAFTREVGSAAPETARARCTAAGLDEYATNNLLSFLDEQRLATGQIPDDRTLVLERFRDELGDWRLVLHSPYGMQVHSPWALAIGARVRERHGVDGAAMAGDDGIVVRIPDTESEPPGAELFLFERDELEQLVTGEVGGSALFAARFRECAARALLLPRYNPGKRSPLWQQRQRAAQLLDVARTYPTFPIILETVRECLQDVYDLPALLRLAARLDGRELRILEVETPTASPFARSMLFGYVAAFMYEGDSPLAERRAAALSVDAALLGELLGRAELRELLDPAVLAQIERELQRIEPERRLRGLEGAADLLRLLGPLTLDELGERLVDESVPSAEVAKAAPLARDVLETHVAALVRAKRVLPVGLAGEQRYASMEDASRLRDALGVPLPIGVPVAFIDPVRDPLGDLVARYARTHGPFTATAVAGRLGLGVAVVTDTLRRLSGERRVSEGEFRPTGTGTEWCDAEVLRRLRSRSLAALRKEVEPVDAASYGRFLPAWQHVGGSLRGVDGVASVIDQLAGTPIPASAWESLVLPARVRDYSPAMLDELTATGEVLWAGAGTLPGNDGWVSLHLADTAGVTLPVPAAEAVPLGELQQEIVGVLGSGGGYFFRQLSDAVGSTDDTGLVDTLWELVWGGLVTNDTLAPLRTLVGSTGGAHRQPRAPARARAPRGRAMTRTTMATRVGPPTAGGRWSIVPLAESDATIRGHALGETLLERYGIVTRGSVQAEGVLGGFALAYKVLSGFEQQGRARRGYFIEKLGAAQFGTAGSVDRLRTFAPQDEAQDRPRPVLALAATDPANPFGAALPWPQVEGHRPGRKAGALVAIVDGALAVYLERGGKTALTFTDEEAALADAAGALSQLVRSRGVEKLTVEKIDGVFALGTPFGDALVAAGFVANPRGLRMRS
ncbi:MULTISPECIES: ATP-dependent helicase [unclassified Rathayibacter]|uniref:ATP-dependent helicase n=1 Tax=unclassified Rathayibacter TaxID=2609250 RepID=UPI00188AEE7A|nr:MULTISPECIES: ATP-dependent helicase [unclassified Rathayibacter]MBF4461555.1 ATP-dependent helicase [Rathayibacter sp. VKM Ac-2879]MBF4502966.1 ATP-dependent helicase [Rathayibacter sp. VKM Ac-2878]